MRVLLVDDEIRLAETIRRSLTAEGHVVTVAHHGDEGFWAAVHGEYDVIMLDIMLPGMSGYRVLQRLREREIWTPVLMLTAKDGEHDEADAFDLGADDYITKPFSLVVLLARLRALHRRGATNRPVQLTLGDLVLDPVRHRAQRAGEEIKLTAREFAVLEYLMRHAGEAVAKTDLLAAAWDAHYCGDVNVVETYIGYLRRKIDTPFGRASIQTLRGIGYRLVDDSVASVG